MRTIALLLLTSCDQPPKPPAEGLGETYQADSGATDSGEVDTDYTLPDDKDGEVLLPEDVGDYSADCIYVPVADLSMDLLAQTTDDDAFEALIAAGCGDTGGFGGGETGQDCEVDYQLGVIPGWDSSGLSLQLDPRSPGGATLFADVAPEDLDPDGQYTAVNLLAIDRADTECSMMWLPEPSAESIEHHQGSRADLKGGMCAVLTVAHSLYRSMGQIVSAETATTTTGSVTTWDPDFLEGIYNNSGDTDGNRGLSSEEFVTAHTGDGYSDDWSIRSVQSNVSLYSQESLTCEQIQARCGSLQSAIDDSNDDFAMGWQGTYKGRGIGHMVPVTGARYITDPDCCCEIATIQTRVQEAKGAARWTGVPIEPGTATYAICRVDDQTVIRQSEFNPKQPSRFTITDLYWFQFDEELKGD